MCADRWYPAYPRDTLDAMYQVQLKVGMTRLRAIADAIERDIGSNPDHPDRGELEHALYYLRHRINLRQSKITRTTGGDNA